MLQEGEGKQVLQALYFSSWVSKCVNKVRVATTLFSDALYPCVQWNL